MNFIKNGSVTSPKGFLASGIRCGIRANQTKKDLALIYSEVPCMAAAVYTKNLVKGAPLTVTKRHLVDGVARAVICNSGNANTCNADGVEKAETTCRVLAEHLNIDSNDVIIGSTGVIGQPINIDVITEGIPELVKSLSADGSAAAEAIMTTDTVKKEYAAEIEIDGKKVIIGAIAKGSGMINPNMATMLSFITTDVCISSELLDEALHMAVEDTYNMVCIDGDTSTNDMVSVMASGLAGNKEIKEKGPEFYVFVKALTDVAARIAESIAKDGEGATKLLRVFVLNSKTKEIARKVALSVVSSSLVKAAMFGADANWGRILCAVGYSGCDVDVNKVDVAFKSEDELVEVCKYGSGVCFSEAEAKKILLRDEISIIVNLNDGDFDSVAYGCDLTYDYVKINGDYRT